MWAATEDRRSGSSPAAFVLVRSIKAEKTGESVFVRVSERNEK
jgi:hypothetical protein